MNNFGDEQPFIIKAHNTLLFSTSKQPRNEIEVYSRIFPLFPIPSGDKRIISRSRDIVLSKLNAAMRKKSSLTFSPAINHCYASRVEQ
jgi:hypothetical protein